MATRPYTILAVLVMLELLVSYHRLYDHAMMLAAIPGLYEIKERGSSFVSALCRWLVRLSLQPISRHDDSRTGSVSLRRTGGTFYRSALSLQPLEKSTGYGLSCLEHTKYQAWLVQA